jgi:hypothetical protein
MGLRDVDDLRTLAARHELTLIDNHAMPVNNRTLVWQRGGAGASPASV